MALTPSLNPYGSNNIATGEIVQAPHVYQFVYAFSGIEAYNIFLSGSFNVTGSTTLSGSTNLIGLSNSNQPNLLTIDSNGRVYLMSTSSLFPSNSLLGNGINNYVALWSGSSFLTSSLIYQNPNGNIGIGTIVPGYTLTVSGSLGVTGSLNLNGLSNSTASYVLGIDPTNGNVSITQVTSLSSSFATPAGNDWDIQLKSGSRFSNATLGSGSFHYNIGAWTLGQRSPGTIGSWSFVLGKDSIASGDYSLAEGFSNLSSGLASHAEGEYNIASGEASHAEGTNTTASGISSHAEGFNTTALGPRSHAGGNNTVASGSDQTAIGKYNLLNNSSDIFVIGSGSSSSSRFDLANFGDSIKLNKNTQITGNLNVTGSTILSSSLRVIGTSILSGSNFISGSLNITGLSPLSQSFILGISPSGDVTLINTSSFISTFSGSIIGTGSANYLAVWRNSSELTTGSILYNDQTNKRLGINKITPNFEIDVSGSLGVTGSSYLSGSTNLLGLNSSTQTNILTIDSNGKVYYMNTSSINFPTSSNLTPAGNDWDIQLKSGSELAVATLGTGSYSYDIGSWLFGEKGNISSSNTQGSWSFQTNKSNLALGDYSHVEGYQTLAVDSSDHTEGYNTKTVGNIESELNINFIYSASFNKLTSTQPGNYLSNFSSLNLNNSSYKKWFYNFVDLKFYELTITSMSYSNTTTFTSLFVSNSLGSNDSTGNGNIFYQTYSSEIKGFPLANHAEGDSTIASGDASHAEGKYSWAKNEASHAEGLNTIASGTGSHSEGRNSRATGDESHAEGSNTLSSGLSSHAEGYGTIASGSFSHSENYYSIALGDYSHAQNYSTQATGEASHAAGKETLASGLGSTALGYKTTSSGEFSLSAGKNTTATGTGSVSLGLGTYSSDYSLAIGTQTSASGASLAQGENTKATGISHAEGYGTYAVGLYSHAEGIYSTSSGDYSHAEGANTISTGSYSHAEGSGSIAGGIGSHAEGEKTFVNYGTDYAHSEGGFTYVKGDYSHAEGYFTSASTYSPTKGAIANHAEGYFSLANSDLASHAEGAYTTASARFSHAEGSGSVVFISASAAHAEGLFTVASASGQLAVGRYNSHNNTSDFFVIGDGTSNINRSNAFGVNNSRTYISNSIYLPDLTLSSPGLTNLVSFDTSTGKLFYQPEGGSGGTLTGQGLDNYIAIWDSTTGLTTGSFLYYDKNSKKLGINISRSGFFTGTSTVAISGSLEIGNFSNVDFIVGNGLYSLTIGEGSSTEGTYSLALGRYAGAGNPGTKASVAIGDSVGSRSSYSFVMGNNSSIASNPNYSHSFSFGSYCIISGTFSQAYGAYNIVLGNYSYAQGVNLIVSGNNQTVIGKNNKQNNISDLFVIGNGNDNTLNRSDILNVSTTQVKITGSLQVTGSTVIKPISTINPPTGGEEGQIQLGNVGGTYFIFAYINGAWRSSSLV